MPVVVRGPPSTTTSLESSSPTSKDQQLPTTKQGNPVGAATNLLGGKPILGNRPDKGPAPSSKTTYPTKTFTTLTASRSTSHTSTRHAPTTTVGSNQLAPSHSFNSSRTNSIPKQSGLTRPPTTSPSKSDFKPTKTSSIISSNSAKGNNILGLGGVVSKVIGGVSTAVSEIIGGATLVPLGSPSDSAGKGTTLSSTISPPPTSTKSSNGGRPVNTVSNASATVAKLTQPSKQTSDAAANTSPQQTNISSGRSNVKPNHSTAIESSTTILFTSNFNSNTEKSAIPTGAPPAKFLSSPGSSGRNTPLPQPPSGPRKTTPVTRISPAQAVTAIITGFHTNVGGGATATPSFLRPNSSTTKNIFTKTPLARVNNGQSTDTDPIVADSATFSAPSPNTGPTIINTLTTNTSSPSITTAVHKHQGGSSANATIQVTVTDSATGLSSSMSSGHGHGKGHDGHSTGEKAAIIGGSIAAGVSVITLIIVIVALVMCRRKRRRQLDSSQQLPGNMMNARAIAGISYIPVFPVNAPPYQQVFSPPNPKADLQTLDSSNVTLHPTFAPAYTGAAYPIHGPGFQNVYPTDNIQLQAQAAPNQDMQNTNYVFKTQQDSETSSEYESVKEDRPPSGHLQQHIIAKPPLQPPRNQIKSGISDSSGYTSVNVQFGVAL